MLTIPSSLSDHVYGSMASAHQTSKFGIKALACSVIMFDDKIIVGLLPSCAYTMSTVHSHVEVGVGSRIAKGVRRLPAILLRGKSSTGPLLAIFRARCESFFAESLSRHVGRRDVAISGSGLIISI